MSGHAEFLREATESDLRTFSFMLMYEQIRREFVGISYYKAIPRSIDPRNHKRWLQFEKGRICCEEQGAAPADFILAQFTELRSWKACPLPMPNHLYSEGAVDRYHKVLVRWNKLERLKKDRPVTKDTVEYYDANVSDHLSRALRAGIRADRKQYIALMTVTGVFPEWYADGHAPGWKGIAKEMGIL